VLFAFKFLTAEDAEFFYAEFVKKFQNSMSKVPFSRIIAGAMSWGVWGKNLDTRQMADLLWVCLENGISSFDHADIYGDYTTEAAFGKALVQSGVSRPEVQLISKCGIQMVSPGRSTNLVKHYEYSKDYIVWSAEQSLKNLRTEYLDLLLLHRPSPLMRAAEIAAAVDQLKEEGKIRAFGVSNFTPAQTDLVQKEIRIEYNQIEFSVTHPEPMLDGSLDHMQTHGIVPMAWSPLGSVIKKNDEQTGRLRQVLTGLAEKYGVPADHLLFAWILKHPAGILPVGGTADPSRLAGLMRATEVEMELQDWFALWEASRGKPVP
jgi:predicted oxidoreductase